MSKKYHLSREAKVNLLNRILVKGERQIDLYNSSYYIFFPTYVAFTHYVSRIQKDKRIFHESVTGSVDLKKFNPVVPSFKFVKAMEHGKNEPYYTNEMDYAGGAFKKITVNDLSYSELKL